MDILQIILDLANSNPIVGILLYPVYLIGLLLTSFWLALVP